MGAKRFDTIEYCCMNGADVRVRCVGCGHEVVLSPWLLWDRMKATRKCGRDSGFSTASRLMRCSQCGARGPSVEPTHKTR